MLTSKAAIASVLMVAVALPVHAADSNSEAFVGIYHTAEVFDCDVDKAGPPIKASRYGISAIGKDYEDFGFVQVFEADGAIEQAESDLKEASIALGHNAVISTQYIINHSADAVYESGKNWIDRDGKGYDHTLTASVFLLGIPVDLDCD